MQSLDSKYKILIYILVLLITAVSLTFFYFLPAFRGDIAVASGFRIGPLPIHYYGVLMALSVLVCTLISLRVALRYSISASQIENSLPWIVFFGLVGARLYFAAFSWDYFREHPREILQIWKGGLSIYGGIIGAATGLLIYTYKNSLPVRNFFDVAAISLPLGQAIGRFGNFFNQEAFGRPTDLPWKLYISPAKRPLEWLAEKYFHPVFLYEAAWDVMVFLVLWHIAKGRPRAGAMFGIYLILYSIGRFFIEDLRLDSFFWYSLRIDQITALAMIMVGLCIIIYARSREANE